MQFHIDYFAPVLIYARPPWVPGRVCILRNYLDWVFQSRIGVPYTNAGFSVIILAGPHHFVSNNARMAQLAPTPWQLN